MYNIILYSLYKITRYLLNLVPRIQPRYNPADLFHTGHTSVCTSYINWFIFVVISVYLNIVGIGPELYQLHRYMSAMGIDTNGYLWLLVTT